jgi:hypothetical protein
MAGALIRGQVQVHRGMLPYQVVDAGVTGASNPYCQRQGD